MRGLKRKQKNFLKDWTKKNWEGLTIWDPLNLMSLEDWEKLEKMNDFETIYQETTSFIVSVLLAGW